MSIIHQARESPKPGNGNRRLREEKARAGGRIKIFAEGHQVVSRRPEAVEQDDEGASACTLPVGFPPVMRLSGRRVFYAHESGLLFYLLRACREGSYDEH